MATASATRILVLRPELETDSNGNSTHTSKCALQIGEEPKKFYPQSHRVTRSRRTLIVAFFTRTLAHSSNCRRIS
jgi:hypothetical protein